MKGPRRRCTKRNYYEKKLMLMSSINSTNNELSNELSSKSLLANVLDINDDWIGNNNNNSSKKKPLQDQAPPQQQHENLQMQQQQHIVKKSLSKKYHHQNENGGTSLRRENSNLSQSETSGDTAAALSYLSKGDTLRKSLGSILKELRTITQKLKEDEDDEGKALDWKFAAMVIDRLCMVVFAVATLLSAILILFTSKNIFKPSDPSFSF